MLLSHIMLAFRCSRVIPVCPCMTLLPRSFLLTVYNFYSAIYISVLLMILFDVC